jgi:hypothetical protein
LFLKWLIPLMMKYPPNIKRPRRNGTRMIASGTVSIRGR